MFLLPERSLQENLDRTGTTRLTARTMGAARPSVSRSRRQPFQRLPALCLRLCGVPAARVV